MDGLPHIAAEARLGRDERLRYDSPTRTVRSRLTPDRISVHRYPVAGTKLELTYGKVETLITSLLDVHPTQEGKLVARFKLLRREGFPSGVNSGRTRFAYDLDATFKSLLVFALMDSLVLQQQAILLLTDKWPDMRKHISAILAGLDFSNGRIDLSHRPDDATLIVIEPNGLANWRVPRDDDLEKTPYRPDLPGAISFVTPEILGRIISTAPEGRQISRLVIDLHHIVTWTADAMVAAGWAEPDQLVFDATTAS